MNFPLGKKFGNYLKARRAILGVSQHKVSNILGYPNSQSVSNWERGDSFPPLRKLKRLSKAYQIPKEELIRFLVTEIETHLKKNF